MPNDILVIDNGAIEEAEKHLPTGIGYIDYFPEKFIFAQAVNLGIMATKKDLIICNDDALLQTQDGFTKLAQCAEDHPEYGVIGAVTNVTGQPLQTPRNVGLRDVPFLAFICVAITRSMINRIGMMDERFNVDYGMEDRSWCEACTRKGYKIGVYDFVYVDHGSLTSTYRGDPRKPASYQENLKIFNKIWGTDLKE